MIPVSVKEIHFNKPQLKALALNTNELYAVMGRGLGKTQKIIAPHDSECFREMPRACGLLLASNFRKMMTDLIPPYIAGLEAMGWKRDRDFVIGYSDIPKKLGWEDPFIVPEDRKFFLHTKFGSGIRLASQDRRVTLNGTEVDWIKGDEAKLLNHERFKKEIIPTNRGRENLWGRNPKHHSILFCTDKLFDRKGGDWIMQMKHRVDPVLIESILQLQCIICEIEEQYPQELPATVAKELAQYRKELAEAQCYAVAFIEADSLENIHALGLRTIKRWKDNLSPAEFDVAILNRDKVKMEGGFYPNLNYEVHGYDATNYSRLDGLNYDFGKVSDFTCLDDEDCVLNADLEISLDWGGHINCLGVFQERLGALYMIKELFTKPPQTYRDLAANFLSYYRHHKTKVVYMHYDPSGNNARADSSLTHAEEFASLLRGGDWTVVVKNTITTNPFHHDKYLLWQQILSEGDPRFPKVRINKANCEHAFTSMLNAPLKQGKNGYEKDKSSERANSGVLPEHATHFSDLVDIIVWNKYSHLQENGQGGGMWTIQ